MRKFCLKISVLFFIALFLLPIKDVSADHAEPKETDSLEHAVAYFFDLRERESFIQVTNTDSSTAVLHVQIWNVNDNCNENNFFDAFTPNDTHTYNMRDIQTNDGNPSGVVLPNDAYGAVVIYVTSPNDFSIDSSREILMGNLRIIDNNGYEYRTNGSGLSDDDMQNLNADVDFSINFNTASGITLSDVIYFRSDNDDVNTGEEYDLSDVVDTYVVFDVNIVDINENVFSCRNVLFSCVNQDHPLIEQVLEEHSEANVASFEYGINNAIPHSKGAPLLCPGNIISEGIVTFNQIAGGDVNLAQFIGLNNGNGRGSFDMWWIVNNDTP